MRSGRVEETITDCRKGDDSSVRRASEGESESKSARVCHSEGKKKYGTIATTIATMLQHPYHAPRGHRWSTTDKNTP